MNKTIIAVVGIVVIFLIALAVNGEGVSSPSISRSTARLSVVQYPEPTGYVVDEANVLSDETEQEVTELLRKFDEDEDLGQIAVVTVNSTKPLSIEKYAVTLANNWKIGDTETDDGVLFLIAVQDRKMHIAIGNGAEGYLTDGQAGRLTDEEIIPFLKDDDWDGAVKSGANALYTHIKDAQ